MMSLHLKIRSSNCPCLKRRGKRNFFSLLRKQSTRAAKPVMICQTHVMKVKSRNMQLHQSKQL